MCIREEEIEPKEEASLETSNSIIGNDRPVFQNTVKKGNLGWWCNILVMEFWSTLDGFVCYLH